MDNINFNLLYNYLKKGEYPDNFNKSMKRDLRKKAENFSIINDKNELYYNDKMRKNPRKVVQIFEKKEIFERMHGVAHMGQKTTYEAIAEVYYWKNMQEDIFKMVNSCVSCQRAKVIKQKAPLEPIISSFFIERVVIDLVGPLNSTKNNNK